LDLQLRHLPGARRRCFHVDGGRSRTFSSGTSRGPAVDVFTLMVSAPGPSTPAPPRGPPPMFSHLCLTFLDLQLWHLPGARRRCFHVDGGRSRTFSSGTSRGSAVNVFTLMVKAPGPSALAPPGARCRRFHVDGGRSRTSRVPTLVGAPGPSAPAPPGGPPSTFSR
jgi:hypothetical protein